VIGIGVFLAFCSSGQGLERVVIYYAADIFQAMPDTSQAD